MNKRQAYVSMVGVLSPILLTAALAGNITPTQWMGKSVSPPSLEEVLIQQHDCWTGDAPSDVKRPGGVVLSWKDGTEYNGDRKVVDMALDHVFKGRYQGMRVHAFCR